MDQAILGPFFAMRFITLLVWVYTYIRRISFIIAKRLSPRQLAVTGELARLSPPAVFNPSDNLRPVRDSGTVLCARALSFRDETGGCGVRRCRLGVRGFSRNA